MGKRISGIVGVSLQIVIREASNTSLKVVSISENEFELWQHYVSQHPLATTYHHLAWRTIFEQGFGYHSWYLLAQEVSEGRVVGCLPLFLVSSPFSRRLVAVPFRDRGGIIWSTPEAFIALLDKAKWIANQVNADFLEIKSIQPYPANLVQAHHLQESFYWVTSQVNLQNIDIEEFWAKIGAKTRNMIRQAEQAHLTFQDTTHLPDSLTIWYRLHLVTQKRLGLPPFPLKFFRHLLQELAQTNGVKLFVVWHNNKPLAATIVLLHQQTGIYGYSSSDPAAQLLRPNDFMLFNTIKWLIEREFTVFDMGSDAPNQKGLLFFKKKWLAQQNPIPVYTFGQVNSSRVDSSDPRYALFRQGFRFLPTGLLRLTGNLITKYFG